jgi:hypothetical protein
MASHGPIGLKEQARAELITALENPLLQQRPNTFAQTNLSFSFLACKMAADHTFRIADHPGVE